MIQGRVPGRNNARVSKQRETRRMNIKGQRS
jgi:hypothetical protein